jgi:3-methyl-2-oxobutanoate hydroxymethyltransferase
MIRHCRAVVAGNISRSMIIGDMPFGSYLTVEDALKNASRLMKEVLKKWFIFLQI